MKKIKETTVLTSRLIRTYEGLTKVEREKSASEPKIMSLFLWLEDRPRPISDPRAVQ